MDVAGSGGLAHPAHPGAHPVQDTRPKRLRHVNFFQNDCHLDVRVPRVRLPDGQVALVEPQWFGRLSRFTLLFEALAVALAREMPFAAVARLVGESRHRMHAICQRHVQLATAELNLSKVRALAVDETSYRRDHCDLTVTANAFERRAPFVTEGLNADTVSELAEHLRSHQAKPEQIDSVSIDMSPAFIKRVTEHLPRARINFDKFHLVAHASATLDATRRPEQRTDPSLKGPRWTQLKDRRQLSAIGRAELDTLIAQTASNRTARGGSTASRCARCSSTSRSMSPRHCRHRGA